MLRKDETVHFRTKGRSRAWTLTQVCAQWRRVAFATPRIWTYLTVTLPSPTPSHEEDLKTTLELSGILPLEAHVRVTTGATMENRQGIIKVLDRLAFRAETFDLRLHSNVTCGFILPAMFYDKLQTLELVGLEVSGSQTWMKSLFNALARCRRLRTLVFHEWHTPKGEPLPTDKIINERRHYANLPSLGYMSLSGKLAPVIATHLICAPRNLAIKDLLGEDEEEDVINLLAPQLGRMRRLHVTQDFCTVETLLQLLQLMPMVEEFGITAQLILSHCRVFAGLPDLIEGLDPERTRDCLDVVIIDSWSARYAWDGFDRVVASVRKMVQHVTVRIV
ncbi:hypothetical protein DACRYDRAFT_15575 [Dacryopinax primogenitus]|uniref:F-box domain-containing protein n=1 Tax=Dacryopinax primogenitus (strain DJM 731) TaxID=1858805 RepID=M5G1X4_DACPD|nr:uncharacterized protein DACRYDRAFT_15575 [Dacryopinax primogenitus]EJU02220.1 hypothetical protein DACRYDRAFT_15575 [Dacryopinax primogenitus]